MDGDGFDRWALSYDTSALQPAYHRAHRAVVDRIGSGWTGPMKILDVGCGTGQLLQLVAQQIPVGSLLVGLDPSVEMLRVAAARLAGTHSVLVHGAVECLPLPTGTFDVVCSTWSMRHWKDQHRGITEIRRVLTPTGMFVFAGLLPESPGRRRARPAGASRTPGLGAAFQAADLRITTMVIADGYGPVPTIDLVVAAPPPRRVWAWPATLARARPASTR